MKYNDQAWLVTIIVKNKNLIEISKYSEVIFGLLITISIYVFICSVHISIYITHYAYISKCTQSYNF